MAADTDGAVLIEVNLSVDKAEKKLAKLKKDIEDLESSATKQEAKKSPLIDQANQLRQEIKDAQLEVEKYRKDWISGIAGADKKQTEAIEKVNQLNAEYQSVVAQIDKIDGKLLDTYLSIEKNKEAAGELAQKLASAGDSTNAAAGPDNASTATDNVTAAAEQARGKMESIFDRMKSIAQEGAESFKLGFAVERFPSAAPLSHPQGCLMYAPPTPPSGLPLFEPG